MQILTDKPRREDAVVDRNVHLSDVAHPRDVPRERNDPGVRDFRVRPHDAAGLFFCNIRGIELPLLKDDHLRSSL